MRFRTKDIINRITPWLATGTKRWGVLRGEKRSSHPLSRERGFIPRSRYNLVTGDELDAQELSALIEQAIAFKRNRSQDADALRGKHLALLFEKPSLRTRVSFTVAMHELGGHVVESTSQTRQPETPEDIIRVIQGYCDAAMIRTHEESVFDRMKSHAKIPLINGLSGQYHPCQILADLMTLKEKFKDLDGLNLCYIGDGNNVLHSLLLMAPQLGANIHYCCPKGCEPLNEIIETSKKNQPKGTITAFGTPKEAVAGCNAVYTDTWTSMGFEKRDESIFKGFQVNEDLMKHADSKAIFMHCMPMKRGVEVSESLPDQPSSVVFQQSENRLYVQKALLVALLTS